MPRWSADATVNDARLAREALARAGVTTHDRRIAGGGASGECPRAPIRKAGINSSGSAW